MWLTALRRPRALLRDRGGGEVVLRDAGDALLDLGRDLRAAGDARLHDVLDAGAEQVGLGADVLAGRAELALDARAALAQLALDARARLLGVALDALDGAGPATLEAAGLGGPARDSGRAETT